MRTFPVAYINGGEWHYTTFPLIGDMHKKFLHIDLRDVCGLRVQSDKRYWDLVNSF